MWLFVAFLMVPLIEIALFIQIGGAIGLGWTLLIVVVTAVIGTMLVRAQGMQAMNQVKSSFNQMRDPSEALAHGAMIAAERGQLCHKRGQRIVPLIPVDPADLIILTISVVVALLAVADFIPGKQHRGALGQKQRR